jgi:hypothetical protein
MLRAELQRPRRDVDVAEDSDSVELMDGHGEATLPFQPDAEREVVAAQAGPTADDVEGV